MTFAEPALARPDVAALIAALPGAIRQADYTEDRNGQAEVTLVADPAQMLAIGQYLKGSQGYQRLVSVTGVDWYPRDPRFEVVYHLHALKENRRLRIKVWLPAANPEVTSLTSVWRAANWYEREVFDLFGVTFHEHPDLRRILLPEAWEGHPLRKDFPVHGFKYSYQEGE
jgi:NADH-quinone oxidoreductase subunit C